MDTGRSTSSRRGDQRIIDLAKEVSQTRNRKVPQLLLQLKPILDELAVGSKERITIRQEIWQYNLLKVLVLIMRQDFSVVAGEWKTAAQLAHILSEATCGLILEKDDLRQLEEDHLPKCVDNMLLMVRHIHAVLIDIPLSKDTEQSRAELAVNFKAVTDALLYLCSGFFYMCTRVMSSPWLLQLLVSDNSKVANIIMAAMEKLLYLDPQLLSKVDQETVFSLMDELIYKLTVNTDVSIAAGATRCLLRFCDHHKILVEALCTRYNLQEHGPSGCVSSLVFHGGLRPLLRRWEGRGFERDLRHLGMLLDSGSALKAKSQRNNECARFIQAMWRGYHTRQRLKKANKAFTKFQKTYRLKRAENEQAKLQSQYRTELHHRMKLQRQKVLRNFHEKRLQTLEILPASRIEEFLKKEKSVAALRIQTLWRGHRERGKLSQRQEIAQQVHAAIKIQRAVRKWLEKAELSREEIPTHLKPPGLTDVRRVELTKIMAQWKEEHPSAEKTREELEALHAKAQEMLGRYYYRVRPYRKLEYGVENLMARLDTDSELITLAPGLKEITQADVDMYSSRSLPIATVAKQQHNQMLKKLQLPWWKTLGMDDLEVDEDEKERVEAEVLLETMGV